MTFPTDQQRLSMVGATGSGKTQAALWHLSHRRFDRMPWVVYNFKTDDSIDSIPLHRELLTDELPTEPGIYVTHPMPSDIAEVESQMWAIWKRGNIGVYVDEGYMVGNNNKAFRALLTQGRSKYIPMIVLSQRPVWMDRFVFSESDYYQVFRLQHRKDRRNLEEFVPIDMDETLPRYHSWYYDAANDQVGVLKPVPKIEVIHDTFRRRLQAMENNRRKVI